MLVDLLHISYILHINNKCQTTNERGAKGAQPAFGIRAGSDAERFAKRSELNRMRQIELYRIGWNFPYTCKRPTRVRDLHL